MRKKDELLKWLRKQASREPEKEPMAAAVIIKYGEKDVLTEVKIFGDGDDIDPYLLRERHTNILRSFLRSMDEVKCVDEASHRGDASKEMIRRN